MSLVFGQSKEDEEEEEEEEEGEKEEEGLEKTTNTRVHIQPVHDFCLRQTLRSCFGISSMHLISADIKWRSFFRPVVDPSPREHKNKIRRTI